MTEYTLTLKKLTKKFGRRVIFRDIDCTFSGAGIFGIAGANGSGKSTLVKTIAGLQSPTSGTVTHTYGRKTVEMYDLHNAIGFLAPYLNMYEEFTAEENIVHICGIRGVPYDKEYVNSLFYFFSLADRKGDILKTYSSGMKQRMKFIFALAHKPGLLILDEPTSNLDVEGKEKVYALVRKTAATTNVIIASNEETDLALCSSTLSILDYKPVPKKKP